MTTVNKGICKKQVIFAMLHSRMEFGLVLTVQETILNLAQVPKIFQDKFDRTLKC